MGLKLVTPPATEPVSVSLVETSLRICAEGESQYLGELIKAAREYVENETDLALFTQTWKLTLDEFPEVITLPKPPLQSVTSVKYYDGDGTLQTLSASTYQVDSIGITPRIIMNYGEEWPWLDYRLSPIEIIFVCGWASVALIPATLKHAIRLLVSHWYEMREPVVIGSISKELEFSLRSLLRQNWVGTL